MYQNAIPRNHNIVRLIIIHAYFIFCCERDGVFTKPNLLQDDNRSSWKTIIVRERYLRTCGQTLWSQICKRSVNDVGCVSVLREQFTVTDGPVLNACQRACRSETTEEWGERVPGRVSDPCVVETVLNEDVVCFKCQSNRAAQASLSAIHIVIRVARGGRGKRETQQLAAAAANSLLPTGCPNKSCGYCTHLVDK